MISGRRISRSAFVGRFWGLVAGDLGASLATLENRNIQTSNLSSKHVDSPLWKLDFSPLQGGTR